ncbi:unnamed protein product, partial [Prorocentrum cordatum]
MPCLALLAEVAPLALRAGAPTVAEAVMVSAHRVSCSLLGEQAASANTLRDSDKLLQSLGPVLREVKDHLEPSALQLLQLLQPCAVSGASYVVRERRAAGAAVAKPTGGYPLSETERSEAEASAGTPSRRRTGTGAVEDEYTVQQSLAAQCRTAALRNFAQLFRLFPKAFFGRWPLVLDFQSGEASRAGEDGAAPLPILLTICREDPWQKVRGAALGAVCSLLEAPAVRTWPVPLERGESSEAVSPRRGGARGRGRGASSFTPLAGQMATTLRQAHGVVLGLLGGRAAGDAQLALRACADLVACTPYPKLRPGLLTEMVRGVVPFLEVLSTSATPEGGQQPLTAALAALGAALKREDCATELQSCLFEVPDKVLPLAPLPKPSLSGAASWRSQQGAACRVPRPLAEELAAHAVRLVQLAQRRRRVSEADAPVALELASLAGRAAHFSPEVIPVTVQEKLQALVESLLALSSGPLRARACKLVEELLVLPKDGILQPGERVAVKLPMEWCATIAHRMMALPEDTAPHVRAATLTALPPLLWASGADGAGKAADAIADHALAAVRLGAGDVGAAVRTTAAQACGSLAGWWLMQPARPWERSADVLALLVRLLSDPAADVRSAAAAALANMAVATVQGAMGAHDALESGGTGSSGCPAANAAEGQWVEAIEGTLLLCQDSSDKARSSALRALGYIAEAVDLRGARPLQKQDSLLSRLAGGLAGAVGAPPPKCQWNACRSMGQVYQCSSFLGALESSPSSHATMLEALCRSVSSATNLKVRIQAAQALANLPPAPRLWPRGDADAVLTCLCEALASLDRPVGEQPVEERQRAQYASQLRAELLGLGEHW